MATTNWQRFRRHRLARFGSVGVVATLVHASLLALLLGLQRSQGEANLIAFLAAFAVSMLGQQRYTFQDRLQGRRINSLGLLILFLINASAAFGLGSLARGGLLLLLPLLPALINYVLLYVFSGNSRFRT
ncbi:MAG: GtrA family protein [Cyanobium sp.]|jgi:putative flippase GtrA